MTTKILPSQLTYEELIDLLNSEASEVNPSEIMEYLDDIVPFMSNYGITPGSMPVSKKLLYKLYKIYSKNPSTNLQFQIKISEYIPEFSNYYYYINQDNFAISKHIYSETTKIDKTKSLIYQKHFQWFLKEKNIKSGTKWIEGFVLFYIYKDFCRERKINAKLGYISYHKFLKLHFENKRMKENRSLWFKIDQDTYNLLSEEEKNVIREARKKERRSKKKESSQPKKEQKV